MKRTTALLLLSCALALPAGRAQAKSTSIETKQVDWSKLTPGALDLAYDWLDAIEREADVVDRGDVVFAPRQAEADALMRKLQRKISFGDPEITAEDSQVYSAVVSFSFQVSSCHITRNIGRDDCSPRSLGQLRDEANAALKRIEKQAKSAASAQK